MPAASPRIVSVNVGRARPLAIGGRLVPSAIGKRGVESAVAVGPLGLEGDEQADPSVHGGLSKAVYAYPSEHYPFWATVRAQATASGERRAASFAGGADAWPPGSMGENLTLAGLLETDVWIGDRLRLGSCELAVSEPRFPCFKFDAAMGFPQAAKLMVRSGYCGFYLAVLQGGLVRAGDPIELLPGPREVGIVELFRSRLAGSRTA